MAKILIIDDDAKIVKMLTRRLKKAGHEIYSAENGRAGIEYIREQQPDLTLMDMHMPVMDGYETTQTLRRQGYKGLIIALTASAMAHQANKSIDAGCDCFISKPIDVNFEQRIQNILEEYHGKNSDR